MRNRIALTLAAVALIGVTAGVALAAGDDPVAGSPMPVPGAGNVDETIVVSGYPAPGFEDIEEAIVEG